MTNNSLQLQLSDLTGALWKQNILVEWIEYKIYKKQNKIANILLDSINDSGKEEKGESLKKTLEVQCAKIYWQTEIYFV